MANNRLWLKNDETGDRILIARYYPSSIGSDWCIFHDDFEKKLTKFLNVNYMGNAVFSVEHDHEKGC